MSEPQTMLGCQEPGGQSAHICFEPRVFAKGMKTKDAMVNRNARIRFDLKGLGTHHTHTSSSSHLDKQHKGPA